MFETVTLVTGGIEKEPVLGLWVPNLKVKTKVKKQVCGRVNEDKQGHFSRCWEQAFQEQEWRGQWFDSFRLGNWSGTGVGGKESREMSILVRVPIRAWPWAYLAHGTFWIYVTCLSEGSTFFLIAWNPNLSHSCLHQLNLSSPSITSRWWPLASKHYFKCTYFSPSS